MRNNYEDASAEFTKRKERNKEKKKYISPKKKKRRKVKRRLAVRLTGAYLRCIGFDDIALCVYMPCLLIVHYRRFMRRCARSFVRSCAFAVLLSLSLCRESLIFCLYCAFALSLGCL